MVRFIMLLIVKSIKQDMEIYIPIWLDLLCDTYFNIKEVRKNLHSNMVRFIIWNKNFAREQFD